MNASYPSIPDGNKMNCEPLFILGISIFLPLLCLPSLIRSPETQFASEFRVRQERLSIQREMLGKTVRGILITTVVSGSMRNIKLSPNRNQLYLCQLVII